MKYKQGKHTNYAHNSADFADLWIIYAWGDYYWYDQDYLGGWTRPERVE